MSTAPIKRLMVLTQVEPDGTLPEHARERALRVQRTLDRIVDTWFDEEAIAVVVPQKEQFMKDMVFMILLVGVLTDLSTFPDLLEVCDD